MTEIHSRKYWKILAILVIVLLVSMFSILSFNALENAAKDIEADDIWHLNDSNGQSILGTNVRVAVIDSGIDWQHPSFYLPNGSSYEIQIAAPNEPYIDIDADNTKDSNEELNFTQEELTFPNGTVFANQANFDKGLDFIYHDANANGAREAGEVFFLFNDTDQSNTISTNDLLMPLTIPKIEKIWDLGDSKKLYIRGTNLTDPVINTEVDLQGHGTHVAGIIAAGYPGLTTFTGIAPNVTLLVAKAFNDTVGSYLEGYVTDAIDWAVNEQVDIISISLSFFDDQFRDGSDLLDQKVEWAIQQGVFVVIAGGNYADKNTHAQDTLTAKSNSDFLWELNWMTDDPPIEEIRFTILWRYPHHNASFSLIMHDNLVISGIPKDGTIFAIPDPLGTDSYVVYGHQSNGTRGTMKQYITIQKDSGQFQDHDTIWTSGLPAILTISDQGSANTQKNNSDQVYHVYLSNSLTDGNGIYTYFTNQNQISPNYTLTVPATADSAIAVGAYVSADLNLVDPYKLGNVTSFSSRGPRIDQKLLPIITAPGEYLFSTKSKDEILPITPLYFYYEYKSGTSMAAPIVAGAIALALQVNPNLSQGQLLEILSDTSIRDAFVQNWGITPNYVFGLGKLNVSSLVLNAMPPKVEWTLIPSTFTSGSSIPLEAKISDISEVSHVFYIYSSNSGASWHYLNAGLSGSSTKGIWSTTIPAVTAANVHVKIWANDSYGIVMDDPTVYVITYTSKTTTKTTTTTTTTTTTKTSPSFELLIGVLAISSTVFLVKRQRW
ncbi:MAG: S8 family serine peptidase [Candidatus Hodarchaeota archaeon]